MTEKTARMILREYVELALQRHESDPAHKGSFHRCSRWPCARCRTLVARAAHEIGQETPDYWERR